MDIDRAVGRNLERALGQDQAVRRNDEHVRPRGAKTRERTVVSQILRLEYLEAASFGQALDGALRRKQATASGSVRLGENQWNVVSGVKQRS
jgi:hypothetical protein